MFDPAAIEVYGTDEGNRTQPERHKQFNNTSLEQMRIEMTENPDFYGGGMRGEKNVWNGDGRMRQELAIYETLGHITSEPSAPAAPDEGGDYLPRWSVHQSKNFHVGARVLLDLKDQQHQNMQMAGGVIQQVHGDEIFVHIFGLDSSTDTWYDTNSAEVSVMADWGVFLVWDEQDTSRWLHDIGLGRHAQILLMNGYVGWKLRVITREDLLHMDFVQNDIDTLLYHRDEKLYEAELPPADGLGFTAWFFSFMEDSACELSVPINVPKNASNYNDKVREQVSLRTMQIFTGLFWIFSVLGFIFNAYRGNYDWKGYTSNIFVTLLLTVGLMGGKTPPEKAGEKSRRLTRLRWIQLYFYGLCFAWIFGFFTGIYYVARVPQQIDDWCERDRWNECDPEYIDRYKQVGYFMAICCLLTFVLTLLHVLRVIARAAERVLIVADLEKEEIPGSTRRMNERISWFSNSLKAKFRSISQYWADRPTCAIFFGICIFIPLFFVFIFFWIFVIFCIPFYGVHKCLRAIECCSNIDTNWRAFLLYWGFLLMWPVLCTNFFFNYFVCEFMSFHQAGTASCAMWNIMWEAFF